MHIVPIKLNYTGKKLSGIFINDPIDYETSSKTSQYINDKYDYIARYFIDSGENIIKVVGTILGKVITKEVVITKAEGFFMGSGQVYTDVMVPECAKTIEGSLEGDYDITVKNDGDYIFIVIPSSRKEEFRRAKLDMNGFEIPLSETETSEYIICKTLNTYKAGTYNIDIDINS